MRKFIENQQFNYVNDILNLSLLNGNINRLGIDFINRSLLRVSLQANPSVEFLKESLDRIDKQIEDWYSGYVKKIDLVESNNMFIQLLNLSTEDSGYYSLFEIDASNSNSVIYSLSDKGYVLSSYDEKELL
jgi:hypothetical protein